MRAEEGFRIPEPRDSPITWDRTGDVAVYKKDSAAWYITGIERAFGTARTVVTTFGNDWRQISLDRLPEARA